MTTRLHAAWLADVTARKQALHGGDPKREGVVDANVEMVGRTIAGRGPDKNKPVAALAAHMVVNIAAEHVPSFCQPSTPKPYLNGYDLGTYKRLGATPPAAPKVRELVDDVLTTLTGSNADDIYFGAIELNGSGVRFYGDICLVLAVTPATTVILNSNSYDLVRAPITPSGTPPVRANMMTSATAMSGQWATDIAEMAALKTLASHNATERRLTTGQISAAVLNDEDYLEVLRIGSFGHRELLEARVSAGDTAAEVQVGEHLRIGPTPTLAALQWRKHRRAAADALGKHGVRLKFVTTAGRIR